MDMKHIIWDWNGTLLDDAIACVEALNVILSGRSPIKVTLDDYRERFGFPVKKYYEEMGIDFEVVDWDLISRQFHDIYTEKSLGRPLRAGIRELLPVLKSRGVTMSVLSACEVSLLEEAVERHGIRHFFEHVQGLGDFYAHSKLEAGRALISRLGLPPRRVLMIGDTIHDYDVATALGCPCVLISGGHQSERRLKECACPVVAGVAELRRRLDDSAAR